MKKTTPTPKTSNEPANLINVSPRSDVLHTVERAVLLFKDHDHVVFSGINGGLKPLIIIAEIVKLKVDNLHQLNHLETIDLNGDDLSDVPKLATRLVIELWTRKPIARGKFYQAPYSANYIEQLKNFKPDENARHDDDKDLQLKEAYLKIENLSLKIDDGKILSEKQSSMIETLKRSNAELEAKISKATKLQVDNISQSNEFRKISQDYINQINNLKNSLSQEIRKNEEYEKVINNYKAKLETSFIKDGSSKDMQFELQDNNIKNMSKELMKHRAESNAMKEELQKEKTRATSLEVNLNMISEVNKLQSIELEKLEKRVTKEVASTETQLKRINDVSQGLLMLRKELEKLEYIPGDLANEFNLLLKHVKPNEEPLKEKKKLDLSLINTRSPASFPFIPPNLESQQMPIYNNFSNLQLSNSFNQSNSQGQPMSQNLYFGNEPKNNQYPNTNSFSLQNSFNLIDFTKSFQAFLPEYYNGEISKCIGYFSDKVICMGLLLSKNTVLFFSKDSSPAPGSFFTLLISDRKIKTTQVRVLEKVGSDCLGVCRLDIDFPNSVYFTLSSASRKKISSSFMLCLENIMGYDLILSPKIKQKYLNIELVSSDTIIQNVDEFTEQDRFISHGCFYTFKDNDKYYVFGAYIGLMKYTRSVTGYGTAFSEKLVNSVNEVIKEQSYERY